MNLRPDDDLCFDCHDTIVSKYSHENIRLIRFIRKLHERLPEGKEKEDCERAMRLHDFFLADMEKEDW